MKLVRLLFLREKNSVALLLREEKRAEVVALVD